MLTSSVVLLYDNARPHTVASTQALMELFNCKLFDHPPHSPVLALSGNHLFIYMKNSLGSQRFFNNEEFMEGVETWLSSQVADLVDTGIQKLIPVTTTASIQVILH
jgi:hypothetical protein